jgi:hypothetical protein
MKFRIYGTIVVLAILGALYYVQNQADTQHQQAPTGDTQPADPDVTALKNLKLN